MVLDFTDGSAWGRALHGSTLQAVKADSLIQRLRDTVQRAVRYSLLIHYPIAPRVGDVMVWSAKDHVVRASVVSVQDFRDPHDMFKVTVRVIPSDRMKR